MVRSFPFAGKLVIAQIAAVMRVPNIWACISVNNYSIFSHWRTCKENVQSSNALFDRNYVVERYRVYQSVILHGTDLTTFYTGRAHHFAAHSIPMTLLLGSSLKQTTDIRSSKKSVRCRMENDSKQSFFKPFLEDKEVCYNQNKFQAYLTACDTIFFGWKIREFSPDSPVFRHSFKSSDVGLLTKKRS